MAEVLPEDAHAKENIGDGGGAGTLFTHSDQTFAHSVRPRRQKEFVAEHCYRPRRGSNSQPASISRFPGAQRWLSAYLEIYKLPISSIKSLTR